MNPLVGDVEIANFRAKYSGVHPLVFQRSLEKALSAMDLFEILESVPSSPPFSWCEDKRSWVADNDIMAAERLKQMMKRKS